MVFGAGAVNTWVLLRGLARDSRHWGAFPAMLRQALPEDARAIALDLPGNGRRHLERSPASVAGMVEAYRAQLAALRMREPFNVLGLSLGAMVAIEWAARHPGELLSAVLVNGSSGGIAPLRARMLPAAARQLVLASMARDGEARERRIVAACTNLVDMDAATRQWAALSGAGRTRPANVLRQLVAAVRFRLPAAKPAVPMLVLASAADRLVAAECSIAIARHWGLPILLHPTAGHEIAMDDPAWLVRQCTRWVGGAHVPAPRDVMEPSSLSSK